VYSPVRSVYDFRYYFFTNNITIITVTLFSQDNNISPQHTAVSAKVKAVNTVSVEREDTLSNVITWYCVCLVKFCTFKNTAYYVALGLTFSFIFTTA